MLNKKHKTNDPLYTALRIKYELEQTDTGVNWGYDRHFTFQELYNEIVWPVRGETWEGFGGTKDTVGASARHTALWWLGREFDITKVVSNFTMCEMAWDYCNPTEEQKRIILDAVISFENKTKLIYLMWGGRKLTEWTSDFLIQALLDDGGRTAGIAARHIWQSCKPINSRQAEKLMWLIVVNDLPIEAGLAWENCNPTPEQIPVLFNVVASSQMPEVAYWAYTKAKPSPEQAEALLRVVSPDGETVYDVDKRIRSKEYQACFPGSAPMKQLPQQPSEKENQSCTA